MSGKKGKVANPILGLQAKGRPGNAGPVVLGDGRELKGRVVVADSERQRELCPPPSAAAAARIKLLETATRRPGSRLKAYRFT